MNRLGMGRGRGIKNGWRKAYPGPNTLNFGTPWTSKMGRGKNWGRKERKKIKIRKLKQRGMY